MKICLYQFFVYICVVKVIKHTNTQTMTKINIQELSGCEIKMIAELLQNYATERFKHPFWTNSGVELIKYSNSINACLIDDKYNVLMMNGYNLEGFYTLPHSGIIGFLDELLDYKKQVERKGSQLDSEDARFLQDIQNRI